MNVEFLMDQLVTWWQFVVVAVIIVIGFVIDKVVDTKKERVGFSCTEMPTMRPIRIATKGKGFFGAVWLWLMGSRQWEITKDWHFRANGQEYVVPKGFTFDGASVPKFLATWLSPVGVLLVGGLVHDYVYKFETLLLKGKKKVEPDFTQKEADELFRDINIEVNGFFVLNYLAYYALRLGGFVAWNGHRKNNCKIYLGD